MSTAYAISGSPANYWLHDIKHVDNMIVTVTKKDSTVGMVADTHVVVEGQVVYRRVEDDGDIHFKIQDAVGNQLTCEIVPQNLLAEPPLSAQVRAYGILRWDGDHDFWEIHPVDWWELASVPPTPHP